MAKNDSFADVLIQDPDNIPDMILLNGFEGKSSLDGYTRLYLNAVLSEFYEIPQDAILHAADIPVSHANPLSSRFLWVKADAELVRKGKRTADTKVKFLSGDIQRGQAAAPAIGPTGVQNCTQAPAACGNTAWQGCPEKS